MIKHRNVIAVNPARVVVLGAHGFISRHLQAWCARNGVPCLVLGREQIDLRDTANGPRLAQLLMPQDAVVMTSMLTPEWGRDHRSLMSNLQMAETISRALEDAPCAHFVYLSSDAVYDAAKIPLDEDSSREPVDLYALSHTAREMVLSAELERRQIPMCILRLTNIYGPGDTHNAYGPNRFVRTALSEGRIELFGGGEERRSHVYIDDAVELIQRVLGHRSAGTLNIATQRALSFGEIAKMVIRLVERPVKIDALPRKVPTVHRPYKPTQVFRFIYNLGRPIGPIVHRTFVNSAILNAFPGFRFTPLENGLAAFINAERNAVPATAKNAEGPAETDSSRQ